MSITFTPGQEVRVFNPISETERCLLGRAFTVVRISERGRVVARDTWGVWHFNPEALQVNIPWGAKIRIVSRTATVLENSYPTPESLLVRYHDDGSHCRIHRSTVNEVL